jgi:hypothetical protein
VGDVNDSGDDEPTISDISALIDALFISGTADPVGCMAEADINRSAPNHPCDVEFTDLSIGDVSYLIDYLFVTGTALGLENCDGGNATLIYPIVETGQILCYNETGAIPCPSSGGAFYGQDANYITNGFDYVDNGDGTVTDMVTGLMWQQTPELYNLKSWDDALAESSTFDLAGYDDWRLPSLKELYSLICFTGSSFSLDPYIDTDFFDFRFGDESLGERVIDAQYWSGTEYVGLTMGGDETVFGVNFADGRIKGYPKTAPGSGEDMTRFARYVRAGIGYGVNDFVDNGDGTIADLATGLMWQKSDDGVTRNWEDALGYAETLDLAGYTDWRLPDAKELQSIVDYTRAPDALNPSQQAPAIDPIFDISDDEGWFWTGTTLNEAPPHTGWGTEGVYLAFGLATGWMESPPGSGIYNLWNVHGAGAQRGDPKIGNPDDYPYGFGPQGDVIRIYNYARCVRTAE